MTALLPSVVFSLACLLAVATIAVSFRHALSAWRTNLDQLGASTRGRDYSVRMIGAGRGVSPVRRSRSLVMARRAPWAAVGQRAAA